MMMPELMDEWFESELLRGSLAAAGIRHITQGPHSAATVLNFLHQHIYSDGIIHNSQYIKGGTEMLIRALEQAAKEKTVDIRLNTQVTSLKCKNGICSGVIAGNHQTFKADKIISGLDPRQTCLNMIDSIDINPTFRRQLSNIKYRGSTARIHFALNSFPKIIGIKKEQMDAVFTISPSIDYLERAFDDTKYGRISKNPFIEFTIPTYLNPNFSPSGKHVLSATIQYIPYHLNNNALNGELKENIIYHLINILGGYIQDFSNMIEHSALWTPLDFQTSLGLSEGNLNHGEMTLDQFFIMRPTISSAQYKTPIENLFLCGPGTHPGGGLHGTNGMNAFKEIINT
jgi:phytoene dehydrogenase-like protein